MIENLIKILNIHFSKNLNNDIIINFVQQFQYIPIDCKNNNIYQLQTYHKTLLYRCDNFEIYQINWSKSSSTLLHRHPKNGCILKVISGKLQESIYNNISIKNNIHIKNNVSYIDDNIGMHTITALEDSISLHIYSPPKFYEQ